MFGQKTLNPTASALDRINVARLVVYIRERLDDIVKPFLFEPNDDITRQNAKGVVDGSFKLGYPKEDYLTMLQFVIIK